MDLRQLAAVVAVVDHGGFTRAADALGQSQPSVSQAVRALENDLGTELFHRTGRGVTLTSAGEALLGPARQTLRDAQVARAAVGDVADLHAGHLDLVCLATLAVSPTAELIGRFRRAHPAVAVRLVEPDDAADVADRVRTGSSEIGLTELPTAGDDLVAIPLETQDFVAVLPGGGDGPAGRRWLPLAALARLPLVTTPPGTSTRRQIEEAFASAGLDVEVAVETEHREAIVALVLAGAGAAIVPRPMADRAAEQGAQIREIRPAISRRVGLVHRASPLSPAARAFVETAGARQGGSLGRPRARRR